MDEIVKAKLGVQLKKQFRESCIRRDVDQQDVIRELVAAWIQESGQTPKTEPGPFTDLTPREERILKDVLCLIRDAAKSDDYRLRANADAVEILAKGHRRSSTA